MPSDWISTIYSLLDSSHQDESNGSKISPIGSILVELWRKHQPINFKTLLRHKSDLHDLIDTTYTSDSQDF